MNLSGKNNNSATTVPTVAASTTIGNTNSTQNVSDSVSETTQPATKSGEASQEPTEQGYTAETSSNDSEIVVPTISGEKQKPKFSATLIPYYAKDENSSEEYSLRDLFGSAYSGGGFTFNEDGTFDEGEGGKWTLHGNTLTLKYYYNGEVDEVYELKVLELSSSKAVLEIQIKETDERGAYEYYNKMTYQKQ